ncbi:MAG: formylglycine-generating enzyme family protein [Chitinophagales bacterium]
MTLPKTQTLSLQKPTGETFDIELIEVIGSTFRMGSNEGRDNEKPVHEVSVPTFWIGKFPVTQALYEWTMGKNPSWFKGKNRPVEMVSWKDCQVFIQKLNDISGKNFRLPTEAEWEYAARGGIYWEKDYLYAGGNELNKFAWYGENSHLETKPVGLKQPNQLGIYDMSGNVREYCEDRWHNNYEGAPEDGSAWIDGTTSRRVVRGGSWRYDPYGCRVAFRYFNLYDYFNLGLRLALPQF